MNFLDPRLPDRFWDKVQPCPMSGCWLWSAHTSKQYRHGVGSGDYGRFWPAGGKGVLSHRHAYQTLVGPVPEGLDLDHRCRVRSCCNPAHLEPVTRAENIRRGDWDPRGYQAKSNATRAAKRAAITHCPQGHPYSEENTYRHGIRRSCKACNKARCQRSRSL